MLNKVFLFCSDLCLRRMQKMLIKERRCPLLPALDTHLSYKHSYEALLSTSMTQTSTALLRFTSLHLRDTMQ